MKPHPILASAVLALSASACDDSISHPGLFPGGFKSDAGDGGAITHKPPDPTCKAACCPTDTACYGTPKGYSGPECLAQFDNSPPEQRWQLRQTWSISSLPLGNANAAVAFILSERSALTWPACNMNANDQGTFMQLVDFDLTNNIGRVGFSKYTPGSELQTDLSQGLCMVAGTYNDNGQPLTVNLAMGTDWPPGLPAPMLIPWTSAPTKAKGLLADFDYAKDRKAILAKFAPGGEYQAAGFTGIFYLDKVKGFLHGLAPVAYVVVYDSPTSYNIIPIREGEITAQINDPAHANCVGVYRGDVLDPNNQCAPSPTTTAWGCANGECPPGQGPNVTKGYFLITEIEQVHNSTLNQTICALDVGAAQPGLVTGSECRKWPSWDPSKPATGLPKGDWCAETNAPATSTCHNAFRSISYATFQGFKIQTGTCAP